MNRKDLMDAREHQMAMVDRYENELKGGEPCSCGNCRTPLPEWKRAHTEKFLRRHMAALEAIDMALKTLESADEA